MLEQGLFSPLLEILTWLVLMLLLAKHTIIVFMSVAGSLLNLTQYRLLIDLWQVHQLLLRRHSHLHVVALADVHRGLLQ